MGSRRSYGAIGLYGIVNLGLKPEAIVTRLLRSQSEIGRPGDATVRCWHLQFGEPIVSAIRCGAAVSR